MALQKRTTPGAESKAKATESKAKATESKAAETEQAKTAEPIPVANILNLVQFICFFFIGLLAALFAANPSKLTEVKEGMRAIYEDPRNGFTSVLANMWPARDRIATNKVESPIPQGGWTDFVVMS